DHQGLTVGDVAVWACAHYCTTRGVHREKSRGAISVAPEGVVDGMDNEHPRNPPRSTAGLLRGADDPPEPGNRLCLIGEFHLVASGADIHVPLGVQRLLAYLSFKDRRLSRAHIAGTLWPDHPERRSAANLRNCIWRMRRAGRCVLEASPTHVWLEPDVAIDVRAMTELARRVI